jgi:hypothetical protein
MELHHVLRSFTVKYPLQVTVHDWVKPGCDVMVWTEDQGHLCPELEIPENGQVVLYVDYRQDFDEVLIQPHVELAIDALGYPAGSRWIGRSAKDVDTVVSLVDVVALDELEQHVERVQSVVSREFLAVFDGQQHRPISAMAIAG